MAGSSQGRALLHLAGMQCVSMPQRSAIFVVLPALAEMSWPKPVPACIALAVLPAQSTGRILLWMSHPCMSCR